MSEVDKRIRDFIKKHHVLTLATLDNEGMWCSNMFYAYIPVGNRFVFTSDSKTRHASAMEKNPDVAASIVLETRTVGKVQGLQIVGKSYRVAKEDSSAWKAYVKRFPYAVLAELELWEFVPSKMKFTDNTLGFGKKLFWQAD